MMIMMRRPIYHVLNLLRKEKSRGGGKTEKKPKTEGANREVPNI